MKKKLLMALAAMMALPVFAQTEFRHITFDEALTAAKAEKKLVFIDFYTDWCGPCRMMANQVFPQKNVGDYFNAKYVCLKLNAEKEGSELAKKYEVKAYPTFVVVNTEGKLVGTKVGGNLEGDAFIADIDLISDSNKSPERLKQRYESGERTAELISAYASLKRQEMGVVRSQSEQLAKKKEINELITSYYSGLSDADKLKAENAFIFTTYTDSPTSEQGKFMIANREKFDASVKEKIAAKINEMYKMQLMYYFAGYTPYNEADYQSLKKGLVELNKLNEYAKVCEFIECHAKGDLNAYLDFCQAEAKNLPDDFYNSWLLNIAALFTNGDEAVKTRAAKYVRSLLPEMSVNNLYFIGSQIAKLEGSAGH